MKSKYFLQKLIMLTLATFALGCTDTFLEAKPSTDIVMPSSLADLEVLLDNTNVIIKTPALGHMSSDELEFLSYTQWNAAGTATERNCYIWAKDIYEGEQERPDWNTPYKAVFYANNVLAILEKLDPISDPQRYNQLKGWAHFIRGYAFFVLAEHFAPAYDQLSAESDYGIPLRLSPNVDEIVQRSSVKQTYAQILDDVQLSSQLLTSQFQVSRRNRPSNVAAFALLSRVYLAMSNFDKAEDNADKVLNSYDKLLDYNQISQTSTQPFTNVNDEVLYSCQQVSGVYYTTVVGNSAVTIKVSPDLIALYSTNDLRLRMLYAQRGVGNYYPKRGYYGGDSFMFTGLAVNEIYLVKAECLARKGNFAQSMQLLNQLLVKRFSNQQPFVPLSASNPQEALANVLVERRKELAWRGLRWGDIRRLNKLGAGISLSRTLNGVTYVLKPNERKYVFPIPMDEITRSGINQNER